jgi:hypothetical protein
MMRGHKVKIPHHVSIYPKPIPEQQFTPGTRGQIEVVYRVEQVLHCVCV